MICRTVVVCCLTAMTFLLEPLTASAANCTVRAVIVTEDKQPIDEGKVDCWIGSYARPKTVDGKTVYDSEMGRRFQITKGSVSEQIAPGMISLSISVPGYAPVALGLKPAKANETLDFGTITLTRGFTWNLAVRNEDDQPVANAQIAAVFRLAKAVTKVASNSKGDARLEHVAADEYTFTVRARGHQPVRDVILRARSGETATISLRRSHPTSGQVVDETDKPVAGARIVLLRDHIEFLDPDALPRIRTDAKGTFVIEDLAEGNFCTLRVEVDGKPRLVLTKVEGGKTDQVWKLKPALTLSGRIEGAVPGGDKTLRFSLWCVDHTGHLTGPYFSGTALVNEDGTFKIDGLIPGVVTLSGFRAQISVDLPKSRDDLVLDLTDPRKPVFKMKREPENK